MIIDENCLPADDFHDLLFLKKEHNFELSLLQIIGGAIRVKG